MLLSGGDMKESEELFQNDDEVERTKQKTQPSVRTVAPETTTIAEQPPQAEPRIIGRGTYGVVFWPSLPYVEENNIAGSGQPSSSVSHTDRVSKVLKEDDANIEHKLQLKAKNQLTPCMTGGDDLRWIFAIGEPEYIGEISERMDCLKGLRRAKDGDPVGARGPKPLMKIDYRYGGDEFEKRTLQGFRACKVPKEKACKLVSLLLSICGPGMLLDTITKMNNVGVTNCDIKASNLVVMGESPVWSIIDWGMSHVQSAPSPTPPQTPLPSPRPVCHWMLNAPITNFLWRGYSHGGRSFSSEAELAGIIGRVVKSAGDENYHLNALSACHARERSVEKKKSSIAFVRDMASVMFAVATKFEGIGSLCPETRQRALDAYFYGVYSKNVDLLGACSVIMLICNAVREKEEDLYRKVQPLKDLVWDLFFDPKFAVEAIDSDYIKTAIYNCVYSVPRTTS